uniref:GNAT family N-acetyltransferase n=1 Tax=Pedobacter schmidteae TaxID=2201271 RepID=UPI000EB3377C|nr:GNAT family N-acetyltransferase [Pedobacter schmidteae]
MKKIRIEEIRFDLTWRIRHEVMYPDLPFETIKLPGDEQGTHFGLYVDDELTSVVSLFNIGKVYQFRKFATISAAQGQGYGALLLAHLIDEVKLKNAEKLWCNSRVSATGFYRKFGFKETDRRSVSNGIDFVIMELELNN